MRALVISDVHSNLEALKAVLAAAPRHAWNDLMAEDVIWESLLDGRYKVMVTRTVPLSG